MLYSNHSTLTQNRKKVIVVSCWKRKADKSNKRAARLGIDPPRPGRKTYSERYCETSAMSTSDIKAMLLNARQKVRSAVCSIELCLNASELAPMSSRHAPAEFVKDENSKGAFFVNVLKNLPPKQ